MYLWNVWHENKYGRHEKTDKDSTLKICVQIKIGKTKVIATFITDKTQFYIKSTIPSFFFLYKNDFSVFWCSSLVYYFHYASSFLLFYTTLFWVNANKWYSWSTKNVIWRKGSIRFKRDSDHWLSVYAPLWFKRNLKWMKGKGKCRDDKPMLYNKRMCQLLDPKNVIVSFEVIILRSNPYFHCGVCMYHAIYRCFITQNAYRL